ncbi:MAG: penicillin-binding protein 2 [Candidatus Kerfeldbacteria bacterium CG15_BIG_FIL_POST_REV_8_21_14_020_45_12]|uniref:Penicillin-binding protein 2 n=1 Tax=Candidatus Kerfeldbacteria bacterium CG15_BIG_FIL_POST_REV_8_21_14_020_45_12 TaxID=2014247 RepID=A0A2M7H4N9_9BACT|nr:MAG: penicillin-binding protein 2 [Candidatus Kerfeldbacteria bacterium CG15_BIG_FIL_POST_REV_8_21_14_020_45_12]PJA93031.1 MAG: penicillin-binding protein 2 [Candidatus Kerfeldbacteria bacterium CG_4_9_14_3_um_filter_45_8]
MKDPFELYADANKPIRSQRVGDIIDAVPPEQPLEGGERMTGAANDFPLRRLLVVVAAVCLVLVVRISYLQLVRGSAYRSIAEGNRIHLDVTKSLRGVVYDLDGNLLVKNVPDFRLRITARELPRRTDAKYKEALVAISEYGQIDQEQLGQELERSRLSGQPVTVRTFIPYSEALAIMSAVHRVPGVSIDAYYAREYLAGPAFSHILGYTGKISEVEYKELAESGYRLDDTVGKTGVELSYENYLRGQDGERKIEVNNRGQETAVVSDSPAVAGDNLYLTIDQDLQESLYAKLQEVVEAGDLPGASAVVIDPRSGAVRALVTYPSYDDNLFVGGISQDEYQKLTADERNPLFNRAITGTYPSGSTFKPVVAAAALEEGVITATSTVESNGGIQIDRFFFPDWKPGGHGTTNVTKALAESVNTFFYLAGGGDNETTSGLGVERITDYAKRFGLASRLGIDLPGESDGFLPSKAWKEEYKDEPWYIGDTYHLAIGQGDILVTPIQVASYTATIANGGTFYEPYVVERTTNQLGETVYQHEPKIHNNQVVSPHSISIVQQGMREAVTYGSARSLLSLPVTSAGKTGTAQFGDPNNETHSWFTAFAPYESPELAITVLVEGGGGGNDAALPAAREALREYFGSTAQ